MADYLTRRDGFWHYCRRVPDEFRGLDSRNIVKLSTKIRVADDPRAVRAKKVAERLNAETETFWRSLMDGQSAEARKRYLEARRRARSLGYDYTPASELAGRNLLEVLERVERIVDIKAPMDEPLHAAILGGEPEPELLLSGLFEHFEKLTAASRRDMSEDQLRRWRNPKKRAIANLQEVIGDKPINSISHSDALDFREWWQERVLEGEAEIETANKDIGHLNKMLRTVSQLDRLGLDMVFSHMRLEGGSTGQRIPYPAEFVQKKILATGALDQLNDEARRVIYLIAETGLRLSEAVNLTRETIRLDAAVPYVMVRPDGRKMKTEQSARDIPLVGVALMAMEAQPDGFPRYRDKSASLSAIVNKVLGNAKLRPHGETLYSLRHTFEDRLTAVEAPEKVIATLMGHKFHRPKYGTGPSLVQLREWLQKIAFKPPSRV